MNRFRTRPLPLDLRHHPGFTLLELLVVVAIIGILASLLMPALQHAKEQARTKACVNNLRNLAQAARMYFDDYDGYAPRANEYYPFNGPYAITFSQALCRLGYLAANTNNMWHWDKTKPEPPLRCPSEPYYPGPPPWFSSWYSGHYGFNQYFFAWGAVFPTGFYQRPGHAPQPSAAYLVADASNGVGIHWSPNPAIHGWRARHGLTGRAMPTQNPGGLVNVAFLDGHVETLTFTNIVLSSATPATPVWSGGLTGGPAWH